ncbi:hypothetical protein LUZ61_000324 [Rhynchospora tenuis]|uniref:BTB domain-containing protein n=1 Tax=Rhynchospora tenuis TaxID=198213 RepID=A0AAD5ZET0_9POAL|nr:hypothetical protein LUZ61_000324 [Rhynchospora tenuis]
MSNHVDPSKMLFVSQPKKFSLVHYVKINDYSLVKEFGDTLMEAAKFDLAGHTWLVAYRPVVFDNDRIRINECTIFSLVLVTQPKAPMVVSWKVRLLCQDGKYSPKECGSLEKIFNVVGHASYDTTLETSKIKGYEYYLKNDVLLVECSLQVRKTSYTEETMKQYFEVPSPSLIKDFYYLLENEEGSDVIFSLNEETFVAHKTVLAARSPVFRAQFFGPMKESKADLIKIEEMRPAVFKTMLHFIYTDMLPPGEDVSLEMAQHLLIAADRYGLDRLKAICAELLFKGVDAKTAATTLALAMRHSCGPLKDFCIDFVASREILDTVMASDGFVQLVSSFPWVVKDIIDKVKKVHG